VGSPATGIQQRAGWGFQILPFIEGDNIHKGGGQTTIVGAQRVAIGSPTKIFFHPGRGPARVFTGTAWYGTGITGTTQAYAQSDYAGSNLENNGAIARNNNSNPPTSAPNGTLRNVTIQSIQDGSSNTILLGEKRLNKNGLGGFQGDDNEGYTSGWDHDVMRSTNNPPLQDPVSGDGQSRFGGPFAGSFNILMGDGAVRSVSYSININIWRGLGTANGGEVVSNE
jgi:hypothetical protein